MVDEMPGLAYAPSNGPAPISVAAHGIGTVRTFELVADYQFAAPGGAHWLTIHDVSGPRDVGAGMRDVGGGLPEEATVFEQISPASGWLTSTGVVTTGALPAGRAVLAVIMDVDRDAAGLFNGWYEEEHLPRMVQVPGVAAARRYRALAGALPASGRDRFLALYELTSPDALAGDAWAKASTITPRTEEVLPHLDWASQMYAAL